jgi:hypothetical protein
MNQRDALNSSLRNVALRLLGRQLLRAVVSGVAWGAAAALAAVVLVVALPLMIGLGFAFSVWIALAATAAGFMAGMTRRLWALRVPGARDAALALQARLPGSESALATALQLRDEAFAAPVLRRARIELESALKQPAPHVLSNRALLLAPTLMLAGAVALTWAFTVEFASSVAADRQGARAASFSVDLPTSRDAADTQALADALGLQTAADAMREAAQVMRNEAASQEQRQDALEQARHSATETADATLQQAAGELPAIAPLEAHEREALAARLENIAAGAGERAAHAGGITDTGREGDMAARRQQEQFVPFPRIELPRESTPAAELAAQPPERRALAQRAMKELEQQ